MNLCIFFILFFILIFSIVFIFLNRCRCKDVISRNNSIARNNSIYSGGKSKKALKKNKSLHSDDIASKQENVVSKQENVVSKKGVTILTVDSIPYISKELLSDILNIIKHRHKSIPNFNGLTEEDKKFYERQSHILENKYNIDFDTTYMQLCAIRGMEMQKMIAYSKSHIESMSKTIKEDFENGYDLTLIADKHKFPYMLTLKQLCSDFGYSQQEIKDFIKKVKPFPEKLNAINSELDHILKTDPTSYVNTVDARNRANEFEDAVAKLLKSKGITYLTENEIRDKHTEAKDKDPESEEVLATPDFLFDKGENVVLNDFPIKWIEVKNYPYYAHKFLENGVQQQAKKYHTKYGNGVFIFKCGVIQNYHTIDGVKFIGWEKMEQSTN